MENNNYIVIGEIEEILPLKSGTGKNGKLSPSTKGTYLGVGPSPYMTGMTG